MPRPPKPGPLHHDISAKETRCFQRTVLKQLAALERANRRHAVHIKKLENILMGLKETLAAIDAKTDEMAVNVGAIGDNVTAAASDLVDIKEFIQTIADGTVDSAELEAQAQAALDKLTGVASTLEATAASLQTVETDLDAIGKPSAA